MKVVTWNVRGLSKTYKQKELKGIIKRDIIEHRIKENNVVQICQRVVPRWNWCFNYNLGSRGRIWILWNPKIVDVDALEITGQYIHCKVQVFFQSIEFLCNAIYGLHTIEERRGLWRDLKPLDSTI